MDDILGFRLGERAMLVGFLDWYRSVVERKVDGLTLEQARTVMTPTGMSPLGIINHLGLVERDWFREIFSGADVGAIDMAGDNSADFAIGADDTVDSVLSFYRAEVDQSRQIVAEAPSLDVLSAKATELQQKVSLRWIMIHMLEETARHAGHLDLMRETIDGKTGD